MCLHVSFLFFFFNDTATTEIYTLSLHDALPISGPVPGDIAAGGRYEVRLSRQASGANGARSADEEKRRWAQLHWMRGQDRKSTRLNSSHANISYAVFCLKKKKKQYTIHN